jgi:O-acetyl-ADP-ribose deacetylase (regulator of RNase III)
MGGLVKLMIAYTQAPDTTATRAAERAKFLAEYRQANQPLVQTYGVVDATKGVYRLPVDVAVQLTVKEWQNPAAAKSNLVDRVEKATFVPPPAPPKPSVYE